ncbi:MAG: hypothetical protein O7G88_21175 [bacterium]|nr:hypothetical protein [bacterium]
MGLGRFELPTSRLSDMSRALVGAGERWNQGDLACSALVGARQRWWAMIQVLIQVSQDTELRTSECRVVTGQERLFDQSLSDEGQWTTDLVRASRRTLLHAVRRGDADKAFKVLERLDPTFDRALAVAKPDSRKVEIHLPPRRRRHPFKEVNEVISPPRDRNR